MIIRVSHNQMEEIEGLHNEYPYAYHHVKLSQTDVPWHWHEALEFNYVSEGCVKVSTAGQSYVFRKGEGFFINGNRLATMTDMGGCVLESHLFEPVFLSGHYKSVFETKYLSPVTQNRHIELVAFHGENELQRRILQKLWKLSLLQKDLDVEFQTRNLLSEIWLLFLEELRSNKEDVSEAVSRNQERILTMMAYIQENYDRKMTLREIADSAAVSTRECLRCFQNSIKQSPMEYLISHRIDVAKKLLKDARISATEIAIRTGFNSPAYFSQIFKRETGKTPSQYRKEVEKKR